MTGSLAPPSSAARFELKYVLAAPLAAALEVDLRHFAALDAPAGRAPDQRYHVRSLYFDDPCWSAFHDKMDGVPVRSKFRLRTYGRAPDPGAPWFLEQKGRRGPLVHKDRARAGPGLDRGLRGDALTAALRLQVEPGGLLDRFAFTSLRRRLRPRVRVDYLRRAYSCRTDPDFRLTFDSELEASDTDGMFTPAPVRRLLPGLVVLEIKFRRHVPPWFQRLSRRCSLRAGSLSKVCLAIERLGLAEPG